jgi:hypothetical protein
VYGATALDSAERAKIVDSYLLNYQTNLMKAAKSLATVGTALSDASRYQATGQFVEKMASVHQLSLDLSKLTVGASKKACTEVVSSPIAESKKSRSFPMALSPPEMLRSISLLCRLGSLPA